MVNRGGRPKKPELNWGQFEELCKIQCREDEIASVLGAQQGMNGLSVDTLNTRVNDHYGVGFSEAYKRFSGYGKAGLRRIQFRLAETNAGMAIWLGKQYLGQTEKIEITNNELMKEELEILTKSQKYNANNRIASIANN